MHFTPCKYYRTAKLIQCTFPGAYDLQILARLDWVTLGEL